MTTNADPAVSASVEEHRGPCPALNTLANEGYLPRSGLVTGDQLVKAINERLGLATSIARILADAAVKDFGKPGKDGEIIVNLADLVKHGVIEHDASLTRPDSRDGDAGPVCPPLLEQLLGLSRDSKTLTLEDLATAHQLRIAQSSAGGRSVSIKAKALGLFEAAILYQVLRRDGEIEIPEAREFLGKEQLPAAFVRKEIGWGVLLATAAKLVAMGNSPFSAAKRRADELAAKPAPATCPYPHGAGKPS
jgi:hypothetical protein